MNDVRDPEGVLNLSVEIPVISHSPFSIRTLWKNLEVMSEHEQAVVITTMSPQTAKLYAIALSKAIENYESSVGKIELPTGIIYALGGEDAL